MLISHLDHSHGHVFERDGRLWVSAPGPWITSRVDEATYREIKARIDPNFLKQSVRSSVLTGLTLAGFDGDTMNFWINSSHWAENHTKYMDTVRFKEWEGIGSDLTMKPVERARMLMFNGNVELNCTCDSFLYWGYRYILTQMDASLIPENRPPVERNPQMRGVVCKHLNRTLNSFPFYTSDLAKQVREVFGAKDKQADVADAKTQRADQIKQAAGLGQGQVSDATYSEIV